MIFIAVRMISRAVFLIATLLTSNCCISFTILPSRPVTQRKLATADGRPHHRCTCTGSIMLSPSRISLSPVDELTEDVLNKVLDVAMDASRKAGNIILGNAGGAEVTKSKANSRDLLTLIDPLCEATIKETVLSTFPDHEFLGEEDVAPGKESSAAALKAKLDSGSSDWLWIVDPIDGTTNFVHGMPLCMPSVAACYKGQVVCGVIYDCHRDEMFTAIKNRGAFMNGTPIQVGQQELLGDAVVAMGSPPAEESMQMSIKGAMALMPKVRTLRMLGSAALMLAWVANGRLTW